MKFETLLFLKDKVKESLIPNFNKSDHGLNYPIILRSNFTDEDQDGKTNAGKYESTICYSKIALKENYFAQEYLSDADWYGVAFTSDLKGLPYYIINLDTTSASVTSGSSNPKQYVILRDHESKNPLLQKIIRSCQEIESILSCKTLDIEFAVKNNHIYLFQARKLPTKTLCDNLKQFIDKLKIESHYSIMSDWNPAEMIGVLPNLEAIDIYKSVITNQAWSTRRAEYGYRKITQPLMVDFYGRPYIDIKLSFLSLIPAAIPDSLAYKLLLYYIDKIEANPALHDKIEFEIVYSCYTPDFKLDGFTKEELDIVKNSLLDLTNDLVVTEKFRREVSLLKIYKQNPSLDIVQYASEPFAGLARLAFIATKLLRYFFSEHEQSKFLGALKTITKKIAKNSYSLSKEQFISKYGHLRPGTYDRNSPNYAEGYDIYFSNIEKKAYTKNSYKLSNIDKQLKLHGYKFNTVQLQSFISNVICLREYGKFIMSIGINQLLQSSKPLGKHPIGEMIYLPPVINNKNECYEYEIHSVLPNFIGTGKVRGTMTFLERADPGYDWIFTKKILGLITKFGGSNSHMALRCHELGIPAVIGCGEQLFNQWQKWGDLEIDFDSKKVVGYQQI